MMNGRNTHLESAVTVSMPPCLDVCEPAVNTTSKSNPSTSTLPHTPSTAKTAPEDIPPIQPLTPPLPSPFEEADEPTEHTQINHGDSSKDTPPSAGTTSLEMQESPQPDVPDDDDDDDDDGVFICTSRVRSRRSSRRSSQQAQEDKKEFQNTSSVPMTRSTPIAVPRFPVDNHRPRPASHYFYATSSLTFDAYGHGVHTQEPYDLNDTSTYDYSYPPKDYSPIGTLYEGLKRAYSPLGGLPTGPSRAGRHLVRNQ